MKADQTAPVPTLVLTGTVGSGKSTVAAEIHDALAELKIPNAAIDLDALVWQWPSTSKWNNDLMFESLASLWPSYRSHGATHLILARVPEDRAELDRYRAAVPGVEITVCRLTTPEPLRLERLREPMPPRPSRDWHLARSVELEDNLANLDCEDFQVENGNRPVRDVAFDVLVRAGWLLAEDVATAR